jgi:hypothetical protein
VNRLKKLNKFQKGILAVLAGMIVLFTIIYIVLSHGEGLVYRDSYLRKTDDLYSVVYKGTVSGKNISITVDCTKGITIVTAGKEYGPYWVDGGDTSRELTPEVTIRDNKEIVFRGWLKPRDDGFVVFKDDGSLFVGHPIITGSDGTVIDENGNVVDVNEPTASEIIYIAKNISLTRRTNWAAYAFATFICIITALSILFEDEMFRFQMYFRVANPGSVEPSGFELASRYIAWCILPFLILLIYLLGLQVK